MKNNRIILILLGFIVLAILWQMRGYLPFMKKENEEMASYKLGWQNITQDQVNQLTIADENAFLVLDKTSAGWHTDEATVDGVLVEEVMKSLISPEKIEVVATTSNRHEQLKVKGNGLARLTISAGDKKAELIVGEAGSGRFVRWVNSDMVYRIGDVNNTVVSTDISEWMKKNLVEIAELTISKMTVSYGRENVVLNQKDGKWFMANSDKELDRESLQGLLTTIESIDGERYVALNERGEFPSYPYLTLVAELNSQKSVEIRFFKGKDAVLAIANSRPEMFTVNSSVLSSLEIKKADLKLRTE